MKDVSWHQNQKRYIICNVPYNIYKEYSNDEVYNSDVTLKLLLLKGLMKAEEMRVVQTVRSEKLEPV